MTEIRILYKIFIAQLEGKFRCRWEISIQIHVWETEYKVVEWIHLPWARLCGLLLWTRQWTLQKARYSLISKGTTSYFSCDATANSCIGCLIAKLCRPHTIRHTNSVELLRPSDRMNELKTMIRTKHTAHSRRTPMSTAGFKSPISTVEGPSFRPHSDRNGND